MITSTAIKPLCIIPRCLFGDLCLEINYPRRDVTLSWISGLSYGHSYRAVLGGLVTMLSLCGTYYLRLTHCVECLVRLNLRWLSLMCRQVLVFGSRLFVKQINLIIPWSCRMLWPLFNCTGEHTHKHAYIGIYTHKFKYKKKKSTQQQIIKNINR